MTADFTKAEILFSGFLVEHNVLYNILLRDIQ